MPIEIVGQFAHRLQGAARLRQGVREASFDKSALTRTVWRSELSTMADTRPTVTSRYLTSVLPT
jgi:hypothetical protein